MVNQRTTSYIDASDPQPIKRVGRYRPREKATACLSPSKAKAYAYELSDGVLRRTQAHGPGTVATLDTFERERDRQLSHFDAVDTKAGVVLGFAGVITAFSNGAVLVLRIPTLISGLAAASFALAAFWPRRLPTVEPGALRDYIMAEDRITRLVLVDTYLSMLDEARGLLGDKSRRLKFAMASLGMQRRPLPSGRL